MTASRFIRSPTVWFALFVLLVVGGIGYLQRRGEVVRVTSAKRQDLEQHIVASGRVRVPTRVQVAAQTGGLVVAVGAVEGQRVKAGDLLVQIDDQADRAAVAQAEAVVAQANARVTQLRRVGAIVATESLKQTQATLDRAKLDLDRTSKLAESSAVPKVELENAQKAYDIALAQRNAAQAQQVASAPLGADSRLALSSLLQAQAQLSAARVKLEQTRIVAIQSGTVLTRSVEPGDVVTASRTLLVLAADSDVQLEFEPDERNLAFISVGQHAKASADAYPQQVFDALVSYIAPSIDADRGSVAVRLKVENPPPFLKPDMTVSIDLTVAAKRQVMTLPAEAVHGMGSPSPWVQTVEKGRAHRRDVVLGIRGQGTVEIVSGVGSEPVIVGSGTSIPEGARVRTERN